MYAYGRAGEQRYDEIILLYPTTDMVRRTFHHDSLRLRVRQFDPRLIYNTDLGRLDDTAATIELSRALSW